MYSLSKEMGLDTKLENFTHDNLDVNIYCDWEIFRAITKKSMYPQDRDFYILLTRRTTKTLIEDIDWSVARYFCDVCYMNSLDLTQRHDTFVKYDKICSDCLNRSKYCIYSPDAAYHINRDLCDTCRENSKVKCDGGTVLCNLMTLYHNYPKIKSPDCPVHKYDFKINELVDSMDIKETISVPGHFPGRSMLKVLAEKLKNYNLSEANLDCAAYRTLVYLEKYPALVYD